MNCKQCGTPISKNTPVCLNCGIQNDVHISTSPVDPKISQKDQKQKKVKNWGLAGFLITGLIFTVSQSYATTVLDEVVSLIIAIIAGFLYYRLLKKVTFIKNTFVKSSIIVIGLVILSAFVLGLVSGMLQ